jgi:transposase-like protein
MLSNSFKWKHYEGEIILFNVRWYLKYPLSYRNLKGMIIERGIQVDHSTIMRSVHQYFPENRKEDQKTFNTNEIFIWSGRNLYQSKR